MDLAFGSEEQEIKAGLGFILSHFQEPVWPRTISTAATNKAQILVYSNEEALDRFKQANFVDCRINAYPPFSSVAKFLCINSIPPAIIMIDLDRQTFKTEKAHKLALAATLKNIKKKLGDDSTPTVLWSGNGYHIYQPIDAFALEEEDIFSSKFDKPSQKFLRFAEWYLSNGKSDSTHNNTVSLKNCMLRIPRSHNSKCVLRDNGGVLNSSTEVKVIHQWNGYRPNIRFLLGSFYVWLVDQRIKDLERQKKLEKHWHNHTGSSATNNTILWIEKLLQIPIQDHRKFAIWRILSPYLLNKRGLSYEESFSIIKEWLDKCHELKRLDFNANQKIREGLNAASKRYFPIGLDKLKTECNDLYEIL